MPGLCHWGPIVAISIITTVTLSSAYSSLQLWSLPESSVKYFRRTHFYLMFTWLIPIFWNFLKAARGPGFVPLGWKPENPDDEKCLQFCRICQGFKPPRSHHCKVCKRCSPKMDHHCPWINSCVGHANHASFIRFLFFVPFGCLHGVVVNSYFLYHLLDYQFVFHTPYMDINTWWILLAVTGISFGAGTALGVFILFATQIKTIVVNCTQIEDWILEKANHRRHSRKLPSYVYPYNLGWYRNFIQVINLSGNCKGDGFNWPLREGCSKYSFTLEQLELKKIKKERAVTCRVENAYSGYRCPIFSFGIMTALRFPCCAEGRIKVYEGDMMAITRWQGKWVYGNKILSEEDTAAGLEVKGWFPRGCLSTTIKKSSTTTVPTTITPTTDTMDVSQSSDTQTSDHTESEYSDTDTDSVSEKELVKKAKRSPSPAKKSPIKSKNLSKESNVAKKKAGTGGSSVVAFGSSLKESKVRGKDETTPVKPVKKSTANLSPSSVVKGSKVKGKDETKDSTGARSAEGGVRKRTKKTNETKTNETNQDT